MKDSYLVHNYKTGEIDYIADGNPITDEMAVQYIPQYPSAQNLYRLHRNLGKSVLQSMLEVMKIVVGVHELELPEVPK